MMRCTVNQQKRNVPEALKTWGQMLDWLESGDGPDRLIVTAVRFQGVDRPSFRDCANLALPADAFSPIDVEVSTASDLLAEAAAAVRDGLGPLSFAAVRSADAFRRHDLLRAHPSLADFVGTFHALARLMTAIDALAPATLFDDEARAFVRRIDDSLESLVAAHDREDWITVADLLEYEIAMMVPEWAALLRDVDGGEAAIRRVS